MKTFVRLSVVALALTGFSASTVLSHSQKLSSHANGTRANIVIDMPAPCCPPSDYRGCM